MSQTEADRVEKEISYLKDDVKDLKHRMVSLEETMDDVRSEQRLIRQATVSNLGDFMLLKDRLKLRPS